MISDSRLVLLDLDGTMIDHFNVIYRCYTHALSTLGIEVPPFERVRRTVGGSMEVTMRNFVGEERHAEAVRLFREHFAVIFLDDLVVLPGALWLARELRGQGRRLAVFTNKQGPGSRRICDHLGLTEVLDGVFGSTDTPHKKPEIAFTRHVLETLGAVPEETCLIGDSPWDIEAARNAGFPCHTVTTGTHGRAELEEAGADTVFANLYELGHQVFGLPLPADAETTPA